MHPLRRLRESGKPTAAQISELLAENILFNSPILVRPIQGREVIAAIFAQSSATRGSGTYLAEFMLDERTTFLRWVGVHRRTREHLGKWPTKYFFLRLKENKHSRTNPEETLCANEVREVVTQAISRLRKSLRAVGSSRTAGTHQCGNGATPRSDRGRR